MRRSLHKLIPGRRKDQNGAMTASVKVASTTAASKYLEKKMYDIENADMHSRTLSYWRLKDPQIVSALQQFCEKDDDNSNLNDKEMTELLLEETSLLADRLNKYMAEQERYNTFFEQNIEQQNTNSTKMSTTTYDFYASKLTRAKNEKVVAIVFGGKASEHGRSIPELLVEKLSETCVQVYTVSRSESKPTKNVQHFQNQKLTEESQQGVMGFIDVINKAIKDYFSPNQDRTLEIYFTMGLYRGTDHPFQQNLQSAKNFSEALVQTLSQRTDDIKWRVILTGTDATLPSTHPVPIVEFNNVSPVTTHALRILSYKITKDNYIYAMSKIGQFYIVGAVIANIHNINTNTDILDAVEKITQHIAATGNDGIYHPENDNIITMSELDELSLAWTDTVQPSIASHLAVANGLTILYTGPHCRFWAEEAVSKRHEDNEFGSVRASVVHQVIDSMDCSMSLTMGARCHLRHTINDSKR